MLEKIIPDRVKRSDFLECGSMVWEGFKMVSVPNYFTSRAWDLHRAVDLPEMSGEKIRTKIYGVVADIATKGASYGSLVTGAILYFNN